VAREPFIASWKFAAGFATAVIAMALGAAVLD
jgi:hypothetical protein